MTHSPSKPIRAIIVFDDFPYIAIYKRLVERIHIDVIETIQYQPSQLADSIIAISNLNPDFILVGHFSNFEMAEGVAQQIKSVAPAVKIIGTFAGYDNQTSQFMDSFHYKPLRPQDIIESIQRLVDE